MDRPVDGVRHRAIRPPASALAAIAIAAAAVYANALPNEYVWDDLDQVQNNPFIRRIENLPAAFTTSYWDASATPGRLQKHYRPLTTASYVVSWAATGPSPVGFRAVNLILHAASAVLVAILAAELGVAAGWAFVAGLVFALHPVNTEAVAWVVGRAELGATAGALAGLLLWLRGTRSGHRLQVAASAFALLVGIGFKESAASAVAVAAAIAFHEAEGHPGRRAWAAARRTWPLLVPIAAYLLVQGALLGGVAYEDTRFFGGVAAWQVVLTMAKVVFAYLALLVAPLRLRAHYDLADFPVPATPADPAALGALALDLALLGVTAWGLVRRSRLALAGAWIGAGLLPFLHIVPFPWLMAERFLYLSCAGFALLVGFACEAAASRIRGLGGWRGPAAAAAIAVLAYAPRTVVRNLDWRDEVVFFGKMVEQEPELIGARVNLASALAKRGRVRESMFQLDAARRLGWRPWMTEPGALPPRAGDPPVR